MDRKLLVGREAWGSIACPRVSAPQFRARGQPLTLADGRSRDAASPCPETLRRPRLRARLSARHLHRPAPASATAEVEPNGSFIVLPDRRRSWPVSPLVVSQPYKPHAPHSSSQGSGNVARSLVRSPYGPITFPTSANAKKQGPHPRQMRPRLSFRVPRSQIYIGPWSAVPLFPSSLVPLFPRSVVPHL